VVGFILILVYLLGVGARMGIIRQEKYSVKIIVLCDEN
jgi:hypothetical protein